MVIEDTTLNRSFCGELPYDAVIVPRICPSTALEYFIKAKQKVEDQYPICFRALAMHISSLFRGLLVSAVTLTLSRAAFAGTLEQCPVGPKWLQVWKNPGNVLEPFGWVGVPGINQSYGVITTETTAGRAVFDTSIDVECQCFDTGFCKFMTYCTTCGLVPVGLDIAAFWKYDPLQTEVNPGWIFYNFQGPPPTQGLPEGDDAHVFWFTTDDQGFVHPVTANMNSSSDPTNQYNATYDSTGDQLIFKPEIAFTYPYYALKWVDFPY